MDITQFLSGDGASDLTAGDISSRRLTSRRPHRRRSLLGAIAVVALVVGTGPAAIASQAQGGSAAVTAHAASLIPQGDAVYLPSSTVMFASFNPSIGGLQGTYLQGIESIFKSEPGFGGMMASMAGVKNATCINVNKQVLSWISGSVTLGLTSASVFNSASSTLPSLGGSTPAASVPSQGVAILFAVKPSMVGGKLPGILRQNGLGSASVAGTYGGVTYYNVKITACGMKADMSSPVYGAIVGDEAVLTPTVKDLQKEISVIQGKAKSLAGAASYQSLIAALPPTGLGYLYLNTAALVKAASGATSSLSSASPLGGSVPSVSAANKEFGSFGAVLLAQANGLRVEAVQMLNAGSKPQASMVTPNMGATLLPKGTMFYLSIGDFDGVFNGALDALKAASTPQDAKSYDQVTAMLSPMLSMLTGEFALGVLPVSIQDAVAIEAGKIGALPLAGLFGVNDPTAAGAVVSSLLALAGSSSSSTQTTLKQTPLSGGGMAFANAAGYGYATLQHWLIASTAIKNVVTAIQATMHTGDSLAASSLYQQAAAGLPKHSTATLYVDIGAIRTLAEGLMSASDRAQYQQTRPMLLPLKALEAGISAENNGKELRTDLFLLIAK